RRRRWYARSRSMSAGMSVSETYRPPYGPKWPAASGSVSGRFRAPDEVREFPMIFPSRCLFHAGRDVDGERPERAHDVGDRVGTEPAGDEQPRWGEPRGERGVERDAGAARAAGDEAVEEHVVDCIATRLGGEIDPRPSVDRLDHAPRPVAAVRPVLVA